MKKLLLASTALVMSAGVAAADVALSGDAWMGLKYNGNLAANKTQMVSRARVTFTLSGETDGGLAFGGSFGAHNAGNASTGDAGSVFISGDFGKLSMGDVDSALAATQFRTRHIGVLESHGTTRVGNGTGPTTVAALYEYTMDGLTVALSSGQFGNKEYGVGVKYTFDGFGVALAYNRAGAAKEIGLSGEASFDNVSGRLAIVRDTVAKTNDIGLDVRASFDATTVQFNARRDAAKVRHLGLGATHDLGGGATLGAGVSKAQGAKAIADLGLAFKF